MADAQIPDDITADYANEEVVEAIRTLQAEPDYDHLAAFLGSLREGYLIADVTGTSKKNKTSIRTIRSTKGQLLLPLFTSMAELREAVPKGQGDSVKGVIMPAADALRLIRTRPFVAAQFDPGSSALVVLRAYIEMALDNEEITAERLEEFRK